MNGIRVSSHLLLLGVLALCLGACPNSCADSSPGAAEDGGAASGGESRSAAAFGGSDDSQAGAVSSTAGDDGSRIVQIAAGEGHTLVLTADGSVWSCGNGGDGQLGWEQTEICFWGVRVEGLPLISEIAAGSAYSVFLAQDGSLWGAGYGFDERLGPTASQRFTNPVALGIDGLTELVAYTNFTLGMRDGRVLAFGVNDLGGLGNGSKADSATPVETGVEALAIDAGGGYGMALIAGGRLKAWGNNTWGTLGTTAVARMGGGNTVSGAGREFRSLVPVDVEIDRVVAFAAGTDHALAVRDDGTVWGWGRNAYRCLAQPEDNSVHPLPVQIPGLSDIVAVAAGHELSMALTGDGRVLSWGQTAGGQLGRTVSGSSSTEPAEVPGLPPITRIFAGIDRGYAVDRDGRGWAWGQNEFGQLLADVEGYEPALMVLGGG